MFTHKYAHSNAHVCRYNKTKEKEISKGNVTYNIYDIFHQKVHFMIFQNEAIDVGEDVFSDDKLIKDYTLHKSSRKTGLVVNQSLARL